MSPTLSLAQKFAALFEEAKEQQKSDPQGVIQVAEAVAAHLRSWQPLVLLGAPPPLTGEQDALIDLGEGQIVRLHILDGKLNMLTVESPARDTNVVIGERARAE